MSLWIENPTITDRQTGREILSFDDPHWSLDSAEWQSDSVVLLTLRKYPGNHVPVDVAATVDCLEKRADIRGASVALGQLESSLDRALTWT